MHGKGAPDEVGQTLMKTAYRFVSQGTDIPDAATLFQVLKASQTIKLFYVEEEAVERAAEKMPVNIPAVLSTMRLHQVDTLAPGNITYCDVACSTQNNLNCEYFHTKQMSFNNASESSSVALADNMWQSTDVQGMWCALTYDGTVYPGVILEKNETHCRVKCMHRIGPNRFFWPLRDYVLWYPYKDLLTLIPAPQQVIEIDKEMWSKLIKYEK